MYLQFVARWFCAVRARPVLPHAPGLIWPQQESRQSGGRRSQRTDSARRPDPSVFRPADGVSQRDLEIVVPPVQRYVKVARPGPLETQSAAGVVVADQLVAPKRVESEVVTRRASRRSG